jgi:hypothetical protein
MAAIFGQEFVKTIWQIAPDQGGGRVDGDRGCLQRRDPAPPPLLPLPRLPFSRMNGDLQIADEGFGIVRCFALLIKVEFESL